MARDETKCVKCGGELDIKATIIGCRSCGAIWGRVNGHWVEDTSNAPPKNSTARDESRDVWVFESGGDCLGVTEYAHYLEYQEHYSEEGERYVPHDQLEAAERDRDTAREAMEEFAKRAAELIKERDDALVTMAGLSSYLGAGLGEESTTMAKYLERIRWGVDHHTSVLESMIQSKNRRIEEFESLSKEWEPLRQWAQSEGDTGRARPGATCFTTALERINSQDSIIARLELHIRNLAARIDGDGGQRQDGETIEQTVERVDAEIARTRARVQELELWRIHITARARALVRQVDPDIARSGRPIHEMIELAEDSMEKSREWKPWPPSCKDGCEHWRAPFGDIYPNAVCLCDNGLRCPSNDGSGFCPHHTRVSK